MLNFMKRLWTILFGYDIFLSYRRADAGLYAEALAEALQTEGLVCFLDREETVGGVELAPALTKALRRSRMLVAVLTPGVPQSEWIVKEIEAFMGKANRLLPISVGGLLNTEEAEGSLVGRLRELSWIDESAEVVATGEPSPSTVAEIVKSFRWRRVRSRARFTVFALLIALLIGVWAIGQFVIEGKRQSEVAYQDIGRSSNELKTLIDFMTSAADNFASTQYPFKPSFEDHKSTYTIQKLTDMDLAKRIRFGPLIGYDPISPPGDLRRIVTILAEGAQRVRDDFNEIRKRDLPLIDDDVPTLLTALAEDPFLEALAGAEDKLRRYHDIENSNRQPFYILGTPGLAQVEDYLAFVDKAKKLRERAFELGK
jgi:hypothetical protein